MHIKYNKHQLYKTRERKYTCISNTTNIIKTKQEKENIHAYQIQQTSTKQNRRKKIYMHIKYNKHHQNKTGERKYTCTSNTTNINYTKQEKENMHAYQVQQTSSKQNRRKKIYMHIKYNKHHQNKTGERKYTCISNTTNIVKTKQEKENIHAYQIQQTSTKQNRRKKIYMHIKYNKHHQNKTKQNRRKKIYMHFK